MLISLESLGYGVNVYFTSYADSVVKISEDLVNTYNVVRDVEKMPDVAALHRFLVVHGMAPSRSLSAHDVDAVRTLRPRFRSVFESGDEEAAVAVLNAILHDCGAVPHLSNHDGQPWHLHVIGADSPVRDQVGANAAMGLLTVISAEGLARLNVCIGAKCAEVFIDVSRNQSRRYCSPAICGNRAHAASFRRRRQGRQPDQDRRT